LNTLNNPNTPDGLAMSTLVFMRPGLNTLNNPNTSAGPFQKMSEEEDKEIEKRREAAGTSNVETVGVALSGGGIRSATFCLGVFQALAEHGLLGKIDYLSTVSGGGYFGSFLGRLFTRAWVDPKTVSVPEPCDGERAVSPEDQDVLEASPGISRVEQVLRDGHSKPLDWLRESGRYLSPNGSGDTFLAFSVLLRNWATITVVLATFILMVFLGANLLRAVFWSSPDNIPSYESAMLALARCSIWWSPYLHVSLFLFLLACIPLGWAYWLTQLSSNGRRWAFFPFITVLLVLVGCILGIIFLNLHPLAWWTCLGLVLISLLTLIFRKLAGVHADIQVSMLQLIRNRLSAWLAMALGITLGVFVFALIDSLGQTLYACSTAEGRFHPLGIKSLAPILGLTGLLPLVRNLVPLLTKSGKNKRPKLPVAIAAIAIAALLAGSALVALSLTAHGFTWGWQTPADNPGLAIRSRLQKPAVSLSVENHIVVNIPKTMQGATGMDHMLVSKVLFAFGVTVVLSFLFGRTMYFLNFSSQQALYSARLARAYLGASNPNRWHGKGQKLSDVIAGDDVDLSHYEPQRNGGPLHLINVTINETVDGKSQIEQRDRKGVPLAVGPCGISVGIGYHALWGRDGNQKSCDEIEPIQRDPPEFNVFGGGKAPGPERSVLKRLKRLLGKQSPSTKSNVHSVESLDVSTWVAVSGAAITTGLGAKTNIGLSLLLGMANVRLGYWWDSCVEPGSRVGETPPSVLKRFGRRINHLFPVQTHLLDEFLARFPGTAKRRWYLSDGGHFENTACYELIRRRVPFIIVCDNGCDPDYEFEDVANLVRKARLDFDAEITFFSEWEITQSVRPELLSCIGTVSEIRNFQMRSEVQVDQAQGRPSVPQYKHATLAWVHFHNPEQRSVILFIKPSLTGDEPLDVLNYHQSHESFPQETTSDQYFDEAQWESYRELGEHIGDLLFQPQLTPAAEGQGSWSPREMVAPKP